MFPFLKKEIKLILEQKEKLKVLLELSKGMVLLVVQELMGKKIGKELLVQLVKDGLKE
jgi:GMP synthase PP-ATPase subunit